MRKPKISKVAQQWRLKIEGGSQKNPYTVPESFKDFARLCQIRSGADFVPFNLFDYQVEISDLVDRCKGVAILKTRQVGASEVISCKMLHRSLLNPAYLGVAFSLGQTESSKLSDRVGLMPGSIPGFMWSIDSKTARKSEKGGELLFRPSTPNSARSLASVTDLFLDECGFPQDVEEMYGNATPAQSMVGSDARRILATTIPPEGLDCWYGRTFWDNLNFDLMEEIARVQEGRGRHDRGFSYWIDDSGWARILLHWHSHPIYSQVPDRLAKIKQDEQITEDQLQREHNLGLPKNAGSLFDMELVRQCAIGQWQPQTKHHHYLLSCDPNFGALNEDYYCCQVWDITKLPIALVAEYRSNTNTSERHRIETLKLIDQYQPLLTVFERNGGGLPMAERIQSDRPKLRVETVNTGHLSKRQNTDRLALLIEQNEIIFPADWSGVSEMAKFSRVDRRALSGHDDSVMAAAIGFALLDAALELRPRRVRSAIAAAPLQKI